MLPKRPNHRRTKNRRNALLRSSARGPKWRILAAAVTIVFGGAFNSEDASAQTASCSGLDVSHELIGTIHANLADAGWPGRAAQFSMISNRGFSIYISATHSQIRRYFASHENSLILGFPAQASVADTLPVLSFNSRELIPGGANGWVIGYWRGEVAKLGSEKKDDLRRLRGTKAHILYGGTTLESREIEVMLDCREDIYEDVRKTVEASKVLRLIVEIAQRDSRDD